MTYYVHHEEYFDDYYAIINGFKPGYRLTIFNIKKIKNRSIIIYQEDAKRRAGLRKLIKQIGEFRYATIEPNCFY